MLLPLAQACFENICRRLEQDKEVGFGAFVQSSRDQALVGGLAKQCKGADRLNECLVEQDDVLCF